MGLPSQRIHQTLILALAFSIPLDHRIPPILIALLAVHWLVTPNWKEKFFNYRSNLQLLLPALLYLLYCIGMLYTRNIDFGLRDLETKLSLLILPLIIGTKPKLEKEDLNKIMQYFTWGCAFALVICFAHSSYMYFHEIAQVKAGEVHDTYINVNFFFSSLFSYFMHPSYFAMYLGLAMIFLLYSNRHRPTIFKEKDSLILISLLLFLGIGIIFLASRMGIIVLALIWVTTFLYMIFRKKRYITGTVIIASIFAIAVLAYKNSDIIASRVDYTLNSLLSKNIDKTSTESSAVRILIWHQAMPIIGENQFGGVGTGDAKDILLEKYKAEGMSGALERKLNAHNQFFQSAIAIGIPGLALLIIITCLPIFQIKSGNHLYVFFCIIIILNFSVESMLEVQAGTIFFSFFNSILGSVKRNFTL